MAIYNERIRKMRQENHMTLKDVAEKLDITEATAQRYESGNGIKEIPYERILAYAELFSVRPNYLMGFEDKPIPVQIEKCLESSELKMRLIAYAQKLLELNELENINIEKETK